MSGVRGLHLAKHHEQHGFIAGWPSMIDSVVRPWFEELKARVPAK